MSKWYEKQIFSGVVGAILGAIISIAGTTVIVSKQYVTLDSFNSFIKGYLVDRGLVSEDILQSDLDTQFSAISENMLNSKISLDEYRSSLRKTLEECGVSESVAEVLNDTEIISGIDSQIDQMKSSNADLEANLADLLEKNEELNGRTVAEIKNASLIVDGERIGDAIPNSVALAGGHTFYSESILSAFLTEKLTFDGEQNVVSYGEQKAEKVAFSSNMITDSKGYEIYSAGNGKSFAMGTNIYDEGYVSETSNSYIYANLKGEFSKIIFLVGHVDGTEMEEKNMYIYTKNGNEEYRLLEKYTLTADMFPEEKILDINYADGIRIVMDSNYRSRYAITDIHLYR